MTVLNSLTFPYFALHSQPILWIHWPRRSVKFQTNKRLSRSVPNFSCFKKQVATFFIAGSGFTQVKTTPSRKSAKKNGLRYHLRPGSRVKFCRRKEDYFYSNLISVFLRWISAIINHSDACQFWVFLECSITKNYFKIIIIINFNCLD